MLRGIDFAVHAGETIGLMGRNGMGKTTLIRTLLGLLPAQAGSVLLDGADAAALPAFRRAQRGIAVVPENRGVFASLSVTGEPAPRRARRRVDRGSACWRCSRDCASAAGIAAISSPAASSRCWRSAAR